MDTLKKHAAINCLIFFLFLFFSDANTRTLLNNGRPFYDSDETFIGFTIIDTSKLTLYAERLAKGEHINSTSMFNAIHQKSCTGIRLKDSILTNGHCTDQKFSQKKFSVIFPSRQFSYTEPWVKHSDFRLQLRVFLNIFNGANVPLPEEQKTNLILLFLQNIPKFNIHLSFSNQSKLDVQNNREDHDIGKLHIHKLSAFISKDFSESIHLSCQKPKEGEYFALFASGTNTTSTHSRSSLGFILHTHAYEKELNKTSLSYQIRSFFISKPKHPFPLKQIISKNKRTMHLTGDIEAGDSGTPIIKTNCTSFTCLKDWTSQTLIPTNDHQIFLKKWGYFHQLNLENNFTLIGLVSQQFNDDSGGLGTPFYLNKPFLRKHFSDFLDKNCM